jgi:hypothetical protein
MERVMTSQVDKMVWDFIYQAVVIGLGISAGAVIVMQFASL